MSGEYTAFFTASVKGHVRTKVNKQLQKYIFRCWLGQASAFLYVGRIPVAVLPAYIARQKGLSTSHAFMMSLVMSNVFNFMLPQASDN